MIDWELIVEEIDVRARYTWEHGYLYVDITAPVGKFTERCMHVNEELEIDLEDLLEALTAFIEKYGPVPAEFFSNLAGKQLRLTEGWLKFAPGVPIEGYEFEHYNDMPNQMVWVMTELGGVIDPEDMH